MRYVIVCTIKGKAGDFNNNLRKDLWKKFRVKSSKLPAHFTIKAPFEHIGDISDLEILLRDFCEKEMAQPFEIEGYNYFDDRVIYMQVNMSKEGKEMHDRLIDVMSSLEYIKFNNKDNKDKIFHVTLASKKLHPVFSKVFEFVMQIPCSFSCVFDNISIYKWESDTWILYKEFTFKEAPCI